MTLDEIKALTIPSADDAVIFLWVTSPKLAEGLEVMDAWGFSYRTSMVWVKDRIGMGYYARQQHEFLLIGRRGSLPVPDPEDRPASVVTAARGEHSAKPDEFYDLIERMYRSPRGASCSSGGRATAGQAGCNQRMTIHDFDKQLRPHAQSDAPYWRRSTAGIPRHGQSRPAHERLAPATPDETAQSSWPAAAIYVDEKVRSEATPISVEVWSSTRRTAGSLPAGQEPLLGWGAKPLDCDFLAYAFAARKNVLPVLVPGHSAAFAKHRRCGAIKQRQRGRLRWIEAPNRVTTRSASPCRPASCRLRQRRADGVLDMTPSAYLGDGTA